DEVISVVPNGQQVIAADPEVAYALLLWAASLDPNAEMETAKNAQKLPVSTVVNLLRDFNVLSTGVMNQDRLPNVRKAVTDNMAGKPSAPESTPLSQAGNTGNAALAKGGALVGFFPGSDVRTFEVRFTSATEYE